MSFPRYPAYKVSGVEWLGEVPEHWEVLPLKRDLKFLTSGSRGWADNYSETGELFIRIANLTRDGIELDLADIQRVVVPENAEGSRTKVQAGDLLFSITAYLGSVAVVPEALESAYVSQHVALARLRGSRFAPRWVGYVALSYIGQTWFETQSYGGTKIQLSLDDVTNLPVTAPPLPEQIQIATFLDHETAKIDALVAEQRRMMELLKEKRQAVISHAVTRGLNPNVPTKPSGIEWLGDVPAHWSVCSLRRIVTAIEQGWSPECFSRRAEDGEWGVLKAGCVNRGTYDQNDNKALPPELVAMPEYEVRVGDVLMSRASGSPELVGSTALVRSTREKLMLSDKIFRLCFDQRIAPRFFVVALNSAPLRSQIEQALSGGNGLANNLPQASLRGFFLAVPPVQEQQVVCDFLESELAKFDLLTAEAQCTIDLLQERRTALISAAVTGQIDVRATA